MKTTITKKLGHPGGLLMAAAVLASASAAIYVAAVSGSSPPVPVVAVDMTKPRAVQDALAFNPFGLSDATLATKHGPADEARKAESSLPLLPQAAPGGSGDELAAAAGPGPLNAAADARLETVAEAEPSDDEMMADEDLTEPLAGEPEKTDVQGGVVEAGKTAGKMQFGIAAAGVGIVGAAGAAGAAAAIAVNDNSDSSSRSPSTP